ncbi:MAG: 50S ribosomal protein L6 [Gammaproteobacteria bacterium]|nr:50S ribosomal protein L6 [Gammaproteobacteria bacterium]MDH5514407.1 50S ribosomal protein L6 [Gammaproteobacteria bacterium]
MSRVANQPVSVPSSVEIAENGQQVTVKGPKGTLEHTIHGLVQMERGDAELTFKARDESKAANALAGTTRAVINNLVIGASDGFEKKLELVGVGYRAQAKGAVLNLTLGFSHPVDYEVPEGVTVETPSQTEILIKGCDKQKVGQVAAEIRAYRPPEPYKGKGVRYADEVVVRKEAKKK